MSIVPNNWGDDINKYFFEFASNKKMAILPFSVNLPIKYYSLIGSSLSFGNLDNSIVYGTGIMTGSDQINGIPEKIISVRGPLTRKALISKGHNCPEHYGDPVLLLPLFYKPLPKRSNYNISIIPNEGSYRKNYYLIIDEFIKKYGCNLINMTNYEKWTDIIDSITGSSFVMSESLHGLIVAETYNIPCLWVEFIEHKSGEFNEDWSFKFRDFYESIGKYNMQSVKLYEDFDFNSLLELKASWKQGNINHHKLLEYFPFEIKSKFIF